MLVADICCFWPPGNGIPKLKIILKPDFTISLSLLFCFGKFLNRDSLSPLYLFPLSFFFFFKYNTLVKTFKVWCKSFV